MIKKFIHIIVLILFLIQSFRWDQYNSHIN